MSGEPSGVHTSLYSSDVFGDLPIAIGPLTRSWRFKVGISITRGSSKNSIKYLRTSGTAGLSGEPRLINNTPVFGGIEVLMLFMILKYRDNRKFAENNRI